MATMDKVFKNEILTSYLQSIVNANSNFIAPMIAPRILVNQVKGDLLSVGRQGLRVMKSKRSLGGRYRKVDFKAELVAGWSLEDQGLSSNVYGKVARNFPSIMSAQQVHAALVLQIMRLNYEEEVAALITTANITNNVTLSGTSQWNDQTNSDPIANMQTGVEAVRLSVGKKANAVAMSRPVFNALKRHPKVLAYFKNVSIVTDRMLEEEILKSVMWFTYVNIAEAVYNDANLTTGIDSGTLTDIRGKKCLIYYYNDQSNIMDVSFMNTFGLSGSEMSAGIINPTDEQRKLEDIDSIVYVEEERDVVLTYGKAGYLIENAVA